MSVHARLKSFALSAIAIGILGGCSDHPDLSPAAQPNSVPATLGAAAANDSKVTLRVGQVFGATQLFENPDATTIEQQVRALKWEDSQARPMVQLARINDNAVGTVTIKVQGTLGTPNEDGPFRAGVMGVDPSQTPWGAESAPLESVDKALELLLIAREDPAKLRAITEQWASSSGDAAQSK